MSAPAHKRPRKSHWLFDMAPLALCFALLFAVSFLPPDSARYEVDRLGRLNVCMPPLYPPLVTGKADRPGFEVELLQEITERLGWRLNIVSNASMGRDFNPRSWRITRAQCQVLAGGIAVNSTTRSFLDTTDPHLVTGWALIAPPGTTIETVQSPVGFLAGLTGLDRIGLGQYLRQRAITATIVNDAATLRARLEAGDYDAAITEALLASTTFSNTNLAITVLGPPLERIPLGMGFWKGDLTLKRAVQSTIANIRADGTLAVIAARYNLKSEAVSSSK
ncbi:transporter substrate-binding domain-containing protein [Pelagibacterium flavum]|uniref:Transporter substrate-binding domain-containing protein n=1 Tax=Pelagibacterium flavum TaxID=2984530 RepID=A0ABY6IR79_9HYPH|nr:transporter substrate-binding domain-containing protein [Pelagibacterium sp. YIM 151497]UYQ73127.1 transporter substrate-binding domain-containing protein [Pelagibacterium sp. YIM 151497]